jgi:catechol 2,3-dioxygenase-like lactoylglutathione lyase family enzyme
MNFQGVVMNVADLERSIDFYHEVLDFTLVSRKDQLAVMNAPGSDRAQIIVLRVLGQSPHAGGGHIGLRAFMLEVEAPDQLERIAIDLEAREALVSRREHSKWTAVIGRDPDRAAVVVAWHPGGWANVEDSWRTLDDLLYGIGE